MKNNQNIVNVDEKLTAISNKRIVDENGYVLISASPILRSGILEYLGSEISDEDGYCDGVKLEQDKVYKVFLPVTELEKSASTFNLLPIVNDHTWLGSSGEDAKKYQEGTTGTDATVVGDKLYVSLKFTGTGIIKSLKEGKSELSASYTNILKRAPFGSSYDFVATEYSGNHIALVDRGRCGHDVRVANTKTKTTPKVHPIYNLKNFMKIVDKHITPEDLKKPVHPVYNLKNFMKIVDKVLEKEKQKSIIKNNTFKEGDHPRDSEGKFTDKGTGETTDGKDSTYKSTDEFRRIQETSKKLSVDDIKAFHNDDKQIDEGLRGRLSNVFKRELETRSGRLQYASRLLNNPKTGKQLKFYSGIDANTFHDIFEIVQKYLPKGDAVDVHDTGDYLNNQNYLSDDGLSGFSITQDGDLISVFSLGEIGFLRTIQPIIKQNAKTLDCFDSKIQPLPDMYSKTLGFKTASILDFNYDILVEFKGTEYADYFVKTYGESPVAFMVNVESEIETKHFNKDQYDDAVEYQKQCLESVKTKQQNSENWITVHGNHIKIRKGETKERAVKRFVEKHKKRDSIKLSMSEYGTVYHALNNNLTKYELIKKGIVTKYIGNYEYRVRVNNFNDYDILKRRKIK